MSILIKNVILNNEQKDTLLDLERPELTPNHNLISNLIYAANGNCVDTTICDEKILMRNGEVEGEKEIMAKAASVAERLLNGD